MGGTEPAHPRVPLTFGEKVTQRLAALPATRDVVQVAAVLGRRFHWELLATVTGLAEDQVLAALRVAIDAELMVGEPDGFRAARTHLRLARAARLHDLAEAEDAFDRAYRIADEHGLVVWRIRALHELGTIDLHDCRGEWDAMFTVMSRCVSAARRLRLPILPMALLYLAGAHGTPRSPSPTSTPASPGMSRCSGSPSSWRGHTPAATPSCSSSHGPR